MYMNDGMVFLEVCYVFFGVMWVVVYVMMMMVGGWWIDVVIKEKGEVWKMYEKVKSEGWMVVLFEV